MAATKDTTGQTVETAPKDGAAEAKTPEQMAADRPDAVADPAPATGLDEASGAIVEPAITAAVDVSHEAVDANPRAGTTALQNAIDWNDAGRRDPADPRFAGQGIDLSVYGDAPTGDTVAADETAAVRQAAERAAGVKPGRRDKA